MAHPVSQYMGLSPPPPPLPLEVAIQSLVELIWTIKKNKKLVDLAFYMGFVHLEWVTSSTQSVNIAKRQN